MYYAAAIPLEWTELLSGRHLLSDPSVSKWLRLCGYPYSCSEGSSDLYYQCICMYYPAAILLEWTELLSGRHLLSDPSVSKWLRLCGYPYSFCKCGCDLYNQCI